MYKSRKFIHYENSIRYNFKGNSGGYKTMRKFIILASLVVCCVAAPTERQASKERKEPSTLLQRPSPINPDVPSDPKPDEKIIKISDPKEILKHKREVEDDPYNHISRFAPTAQPTLKVEKHHSQEEEPSAESVSTHHRHRRQVDPHRIGAAAAGVTPLISRDEDKEPQDNEAAHSTEELAVPTEEPDMHETTQVKRDIPVPLVPKYHHPDESPKSGEKQQKDEHKSSESSESDEDSKENVPAEPIQNHQPIHQVVNPQLSQPSLAAVQNNKLAVDTKPATEHNKPVEVHNNTPTGEPLAVHPQLVQPHQSEISAQTAHPEEVAAEHDKPMTAKNNTPPLEQLAGIKPTQIIAYETPASESNIAIKHPVPVAELFSRPKE